MLTYWCYSLSWHSLDGEGENKWQMKSHPSRLQLQTSKSKKSHLPGTVTWPQRPFQSVWLQTVNTAMLIIANPFEIAVQILFIACIDNKIVPLLVNMSLLIKPCLFLWFNGNFRNVILFHMRIIFPKKAFIALYWAAEFQKWSLVIQLPHRFCNPATKAKMIYYHPTTASKITWLLSYKNLCLLDNNKPVSGRCRLKSMWPGQSCAVNRNRKVGTNSLEPRSTNTIQRTKTPHYEGPTSLKQGRA